MSAIAPFLGMFALTYIYVTVLAGAGVHVGTRTYWELMALFIASYGGGAIVGTLQ